jgi:1-acyl-sn-glycerol-3-phosphate acyltransferase
VDARGAPPSPPFFLVSNHLSYVDIALLASRAEAVFVARGDLAGWPVFGLLSRSVGTVYLDREAKRDIPRAAAAMEGKLREGVGVVLFPEGTSSDGSGVLPFRPSLLDPAARLGIPVHWAVVDYRTAPEGPPARQAVCWFDDMEFLPHLLHLMRTSGFEARVVFGDTPVSGSDRKALAQDLHAAVLRAKEAVAW